MEGVRRVISSNLDGVPHWCPIFFKLCIMENQRNKTPNGVSHRAYSPYETFGKGFVGLGFLLSLTLYGAILGVIFHVAGAIMVAVGTKSWSEAILWFLVPIGLFGVYLLLMDAI